jgi:DNA-binding transcriptional LysR family regulator
MDVEDLRLLEAVAAEGSFSRAATRLMFSQPSVSTRVAAVERAIGARLFVRDARGARLTAAGERYLRYVRRCLHLLEQGRHAAAAERAEQTIRVGVPASYGPVLAPLLAGAAAGPQLALSIRAGHSAELREELLDGLLDLALTIPGAVPAGITSRPAAESQIVALAAAPDAPAGPAAPAAPAGSGGRRFAVHRWSQDADDVISELLAADTPGHRITVVSPAATALALALHSGYVAIVPRITAMLELQAGWLQPVALPLPGFTARLDYLYPTRHPRRDQLDAIGRAVRQAIRGRTERTSGLAPAAAAEGPPE